MSRLFHLIPMPDGPFEGLDLTTRAVFGLLWDRYRLSCHRTIGGDGRYVAGMDETVPDGCDSVYTIYAQPDLAHDLGVSLRTVQRAVNALHEAHLIMLRRDGFGGPVRVYVARSVRAWLLQRTTDG